MGGGSAPVNRIVLAGASNLTLSMDLVIRLIQERCGGPSDVLVAAGHGRSFGKPSRVLARGLPGITGCGLWPRLRGVRSLPTYALLTDIGNDIAYGHKPEDLLGWIAFCVDELKHHGNQIVMTNVQLPVIEHISDRRFLLLRSIFFPFSKVRKGEVIEGARVVHRGLREMARHKNFTLCELAPEWLGPDLIHLRCGKRRPAYQALVARFPVRAEHLAPQRPASTGRSRWTRRRPRFAYETVFGWERRHPQPSAVLGDGTQISLF